jgi:hypothetical protein
VGKITILGTPKPVAQVATVDPATLVITPTPTTQVRVTSALRPSTLKIRAPGPQGPRGLRGEQGIQGPVGPKSSEWQTYTFNYPSLEWYVNHNFNTRRFVVVIRDQDGALHLTNPTILDNNTFILQFTEPMAGTVDVLFEVN